MKHVTLLNNVDITWSKKVMHFLSLLLYIKDILEKYVLYMMTLIDIFMIFLFKLVLTQKSQIDQSMKFSI